MNETRMMKLGGAILLAILLVIGFYTSFIYEKAYVPFAQFDDTKLQSQAVALWDREAQDWVYTINGDERLAPASLTKILTVYTALELGADLNEEVKVNTALYQSMVEKNASMAGFYGDEDVTMGDLLYGTMLSSGGEAAGSAAISMSGSMEDFVFEMNQVAKEIPMENSLFTNPIGMDDEQQYASAKDLALLLDKALTNPTFREIFTKPMYWTSKNANHPDGLLLESTVLSVIPPTGHPAFQILGGKSGTTEKSGLCWATLAKVQGKEYILVTMGAVDRHDDSVPQWHDAQLLLSELVDPKDIANMPENPLPALTKPEGGETEGRPDGEGQGVDDQEGTTEQDGQGTDDHETDTGQ